MAAMNAFGSPIPLSELEGVLAWVDTFKLSRPTKKINRDFADAVLLAEILAVHYPKLVEMHNYPPRNSHALKLNNWMTLNRKVLKKLRLNLCCNTMEQLANAAPGIIERVLVMVRDRIRRDEKANKSMKDAEQNMSSGGSYYEACGDEDGVLVVPVKTRVNGVMETIQQKVISYETYMTTKEELKDAKDTADLLKQKVEHLDNLMKLKDERINELQKQLERKQSRRKDVEVMQNSISVPFEEVPSPTPVNSIVIESINILSKSQSLRTMESSKTIPEKESSSSITQPSSCKITPKPSYSDVCMDRKDSRNDMDRKDSRNDMERKDSRNEIDRIKSDVFKEAEVIEERNPEGFQDSEEFKDSEQDVVTTIEGTIQKEIKDIVKPADYVDTNSYFN